MYFTLNKKERGKRKEKRTNITSKSNTTKREITNNITGEETKPPPATNKK